MRTGINTVDISRQLREIKEAMVTKRELEQALETIAVLSNKDTMKQIRHSEQDIKNKEYRVIDTASELWDGR